MPKTKPPGLTPIWLLMLALALGIFITTFAPIVASPDPVKLSDWLGFAGSLGGAIVALIAAWKAWSAVQDQIQQAERLETSADGRSTPRYAPFSRSNSANYQTIVFAPLMRS